MDAASCPSKLLRDAVSALLGGSKSSHLLLAIVAFRSQFVLQDKDCLNQPSRQIVKAPSAKELPGVKLFQQSHTF
jgi:hypothetical protein